MQTKTVFRYIPETKREKNSVKYRYVNKIMYRLETRYKRLTIYTPKTIRTEMLYSIFKWYNFPERAHKTT